MVGVLARKGQSTQGDDQDDTLIVPFSTAKKKILGVSQANARSVGAILIKVGDAERMDEAAQEIRELLRQRHHLQQNDDDDFALRNLAEILASQEAASRVLSLLLAAVATVSLVVGGIGIMNIMLVSVTERTHEIGLRRAVGARRTDILRQFLVEALFVIDPDIFQTQVNQARAQVDAAKALVLNQRAAVTKARADLENPTLFLIAQDLTKMQVDTNVDEADVGRVQVAQAVSFTVDSFPGEIFTGEVVQVRKAPQVLQNVVTYDVVVSAPNPGLKLLPAMTANVRIVTDRREDVLKVPNAALRFRPPGAGSERSSSAGPRGQQSAPSAGRGGLPGQVWVVGADARPRAVVLRLGISDGAFTEVVEGDVGERKPVIVGLGSSTPTPAGPAAGGPRLRL